jgi:hypothetical protein
VTGRQERRFKQLLGNLKERRGHWNLRAQKHYVALCGEITLEESVNISCGIPFFSKRDYW